MVFIIFHIHWQRDELLFRLQAYSVQIFERKQIIPLRLEASPLFTKNKHMNDNCMDITFEYPALQYFLSQVVVCLLSHFVFIIVNILELFVQIMFVNIPQFNKKQKKRLEIHVSLYFWHIPFITRENYMIYDKWEKQNVYIQIQQITLFVNINNSQFINWKKSNFL